MCDRVLVGFVWECDFVRVGLRMRSLRDVSRSRFGKGCFGNAIALLVGIGLGVRSRFSRVGLRVRSRFSKGLFENAILLGLVGYAIAIWVRLLWVCDRL
jgi:hypothetical protein